MNRNQISDEDIRAGLSLPLGPDAAPFELSIEEQSYGPEDWAWLFLSMNQQYRDAYAIHASDDDLDLTAELQGRRVTGIKRDKDGSCAAQFGLSAWLPLSLLSLPKFTNEGDSWFFPLKRPVAEDYEREEVSTVHYIRVRPYYSPKLDPYPYIFANETILGYRPPKQIPLRTGNTLSTLNLIWVAIDCSIPPAGQISALKRLVSTISKKLNWPENDASDQFGVCDIAESDAFKRKHFKRAANATSKVTDLRTVWRAVLIDAVGPQVAQLEFLLRALNEIHSKLITDELVPPPPYERLKKTLPKEEDNDGTARSGGNYLKALLVLAELGEHDTRRISQIIIGRSVGNRYSHNWKRTFDEKIDSYIEQAEQMINGGYQLLIHTQRPTP